MSMLMYEQPPEAIAQPWVDEAGAFVTLPQLRRESKRMRCLASDLIIKDSNLKNHVFFGEEFQALAVFQSHGHDHVDTDAPFLCSAAILRMNL